ncbi:MAG: hypothetical protein HZB55_02600 [Deltaproteobacteria bacterium]|nr:hypothetical protein [Deltaproteobacteria bacterium]
MYLDEKTFWDLTHRKVAAGIHQLVGAGQPADLVSVSAVVKSQGVAASFVNSLTDSAIPDAARVAHYVGTLRTFEARRALQLAMRKLEPALADLRAELDLAELLQAAQAVARPRGGTAVLLDGSPAIIRRPLSLLGGLSYGAAWPYVRDPQGAERQALVIVRRDGRLFSDAGLNGAEPLTALGVGVDLPETPPDLRTWSGAGVARYVAGERPDPADVFRRIGAVLGHFMDFNRSFGSQADVTDLLACYALATYFLPAFEVIGYLQSSGERGSGKTHLLALLAEVSYLGTLILSSSSSATLRDLAAYGAFLAFDDAEAVMDPRKSDPLKRELLLAGNRAGVTIAMKEPSAARDGTWLTRYIAAFASRAFSAIRLPDIVLGSRTIVVPLIRSDDPERTCRNPQDPDAWPHERRRLVDDLWAAALAHLPTVRAYNAEVPRVATLRGRDLDTWRAPLAVALWLDREHGVTGLFERLEALSVRYQRERDDTEADDLTRLALLALAELVPEGREAPVVFEPSELVEVVKRLALQEGIPESEASGRYNARKLGRLLLRLRFDRAPRTNRAKRWQTTRGEVEARCRSYGVPCVPSLLEGPSEEETAQDTEGRETVTL